MISLFIQCIIFLCVLGLSWINASQFPWPLANATVEYSQMAYCDFNAGIWNDNMRGFELTATFSKDEIVGYVGYNINDNNIYVVYRGTSNIQNWLDNLQITFTDCPQNWEGAGDKCKVHKGWYHGEQKVFNDVVLPAVQKLKVKYEFYNVVVTGHSLGAALATITAIDLIANGVSNVQTINFGSPRVGNKEFAEFASKYIPSIHRVTHHKDMVVHVPLDRYLHVEGEWYEDPELSVKECHGYQDPSCSDQWFINNISDHLLYLGLPLGSDKCDNIMS